MHSARFSVTVTERRQEKVDGCDTMISTYPSRGGAPLALDELTEFALRAGEELAQNLGTHLHHGDFIVTTDIPTVRAWGVMDEHRGCPECAADIDRVVARLTERPDDPVLIGQLYWAG